MCWANDQDAKPSENVVQVVLLELFVQADCTTCPHVEFCLEDMYWEYGPEKIILLEEHLWNDGYDTKETNARYDWYVTEGKKGTPDLFINGLTKRIQGLLCDDLEENYICCKKIIDSEFGKYSYLKISAEKIISDTDMLVKGKISNISTVLLNDLSVCGMIYQEGDEAGLSYWVRDILPFQDLPLQFFPETSIDYKFISELLISEENRDNFHVVIFVQNLLTKEVLQAIHVE